MPKLRRRSRQDRVATAEFGLRVVRCAPEVKRADSHGRGHHHCHSVHDLGISVGIGPGGGTGPYLAPSVGVASAHRVRRAARISFPGKTRTVSTMPSNYADENDAPRASLARAFHRGR